MLTRIYNAHLWLLFYAVVSSFGGDYRGGFVAASYFVYFQVHHVKCCPMSLESQRAPIGVLLFGSCQSCGRHTDFVDPYSTRGFEVRPLDPSGVSSTAYFNDSLVSLQNATCTTRVSVVAVTRYSC